MVPKRVFVAGHQGMVGSGLTRLLEAGNDCIVVKRSRLELDLLDQANVACFFEAEKIDEVYLAAARVGGIYANSTLPAEFIYQNLMIQCNVIHAAHLYGVQKLLFLGSSCIYPREVEQPLREESLMTGTLEPTNEPYAVAKIVGIKLCESYNRQYGRDYRCVMPTNLYGPHDNFHESNSHVIPALLRRFHEAVVNNAKEVVVWGSGTPLREFLFVDDMARACLHIMGLPRAQLESFTRPMLSHINIGTGVELSIRELAETVARVTGFTGRLVFDSSKPDGTPRKVLDTTRLTALGWRPKVELHEGLRLTYRWFLESQRSFRAK